MITHRDIIEKLGGPADLARKAKLPYARVAQQFKRSKISSKYWTLYSEIAKQEGHNITVPMFAGSIDRFTHAPLSDQ